MTDHEAAEIDALIARADPERFAQVIHNLALILFDERKRPGPMAPEATESVPMQ